MFMNHVLSNGCKSKEQLDVSSVYKNTTSLMSLHLSKKTLKIVLNTFFETKSVCFEAFSTHFIFGSSSVASSTWTKQFLKWSEDAFTHHLNLWIVNFKSGNQRKVQVGLHIISIIWIRLLTFIKTQTTRL
jgi:hypothetical protein